jgi:hypothetical protein
MDEAKLQNARLVAVEAAASVLGSFCCVYVGQPLDTIKVRMQARPEVSSRAHLHLQFALGNAVNLRVPNTKQLPIHYGPTS